MKWRPLPAWWQRFAGFPLWERGWTLPLVCWRTDEIRIASDGLVVATTPITREDVDLREWLREQRQTRTVAPPPRHFDCRHATLLPTKEAP